MPKKAKVSEPGDWSRKTKIISVRLTPEEKDLFDTLLKQSGFPNFQKAFEAWLRAHGQTSSLSELESAYLDAKAKSDEAWRELGDKRIRMLAALYKSLGGNPQQFWLDDIDKICAEMMKRYGGDIRDILIFKSWVHRNKAMKELETQLRGAPKAALTVQESPEPKDQELERGYPPPSSHV